MLQPPHPQRLPCLLIARPAVTLLAGMLLALTLLAAEGCGWGEPRRPPARHLLLISIDTLRADHLGCYGYPAPVSPHLDRFRREAVLFRQAIAQAPSTLPSHASMFTSLLPSQHGASFAAHTALPDSMTTLAEVLQQHGFATAAFHNAGQLRAQMGLGQGFDVYRRVRRHRFSAVVGRALEWLDTVGDRPFFLFLHTYEVHHPYEPQPRYLEALESGYRGALPDTISLELLKKINAGTIPFSHNDLEHVIAAYDAEIRSMDEAFGRLVADLRQRGLYDRTLIVFTSDHGEEMGEHGWVGWHSHTLYDELLRVPLLLKLPAEGGGGSPAEAAGEGAAVETQVRLLDLAPTLLAAAGVPVPEVFSGTDLRPLLDDPGSLRLPAVSQIDVPGWSETSIRTRRWKLWGERLFDLERDPAETLDLSARYPEQVRALREARERALARRPGVTGEAAGLDAEAAEELRALGYLD